MDSSPVLRPQHQNKIHSDHMRMKNGLNKMPADTKPSKHLSVPHLSQQDIENQDPGSSGNSQKARPGISRLPVLAKSLHLQTPLDFTQSHKRWEEKPLAGKARTKKPCTKPVPFNFSQPKTMRMATENPRFLTVATSRTGKRATQPEKILQNAHPKTKNMNAKQMSIAAANTHDTKLAIDHAAHLSTAHHLATKKASPAVLTQSNGDSTRRTEKPQENQRSSTDCLISHVSKPIAKAAGLTLHWTGLTLSGQPAPSSTFTTSSAALSNPLSHIPNNNTMQNTVTSLAQECQGSTEACLNNLDLLSLKDSSKTHHISQTVQAAPHVNLSNGSAGKEEAFQSDHAALLSILKNEGVGAMGLGSATPSATKPYNYLPQRVSVMKSRQTAGPATGPAKSVQFSPDPTALRSILQNEGVKAGGPLGTTPRNSACPTGRGTSIYTAQRVPVSKSRAETTGGPVVIALRETPVMKWTPQRVPDTRHQSSVRRLLASAHRTPYAGSPRLRGPQDCNAKLEPHKEEVVQRLFDDQEDEQSTNDKDPEPEAERLPDQASTTKSHSEQQGDSSRSHRDDNDDDEKEQQRSTGGHPFFQAPHRESVIFFSTGKKLFRAPRVEKQESFVQPEQHGSASTAQEEKPSGTCPAGQVNPSAPSLHRDLVVQRSGVPGLAVALLRKRLPNLEELRLDEEVATYTSVPAPPAFQPARPRCENPLASALHFQESTRFLPITSSGSSSACSSPGRVECHTGSFLSLGY